MTTKNTIDNYLEQADWRVRENSNRSFSIQGLNMMLAEEATAKYCLDSVYPADIARAHREGSIYIHDLGNGLESYCTGWDLTDLLVKGFRGVRGKVQAKPAKHFRVALLHAVNFLYTVQNETAGAVAFSNFDTLMSAFIKSDSLSYDEVKQSIQEFIYNINVPTRQGAQSPFTNITLDLEVPEHMKKLPAIVGGKPADFTYGELQGELDMFNRAFAEVMLEGDAGGRPFSFPIPTYSITRGFDWDNPNHKAIWAMTSKYGIPYFSNYINSDMKPEDIRSLCCRLRVENGTLYKRGGGLFGSQPKTGSVGVCTINLPRIGFVSDNEEEFFDALTAVMFKARDALEIKRKLIEDLTEKGLFPYSSYYLQDIRDGGEGYWHNHFSTIGLIGMNDAILNLFGYGIEDKKGKEFAIRVLNYMRNVISSFQHETGNLYNLEATPAEGASLSLAKKDLSEFGDKIRFYNMEFSGGTTPYYANSTQLPAATGLDVFGVLDHQDDLQVLYTGGTVQHVFLGESGPNPESVKKLVKKIAENYRLPYFSITPTFSICPSHGYMAGEHLFCPECGERSEVYSRVVGYIRPIEQWNDGKVSEFFERTHYNEKGEHYEYRKS